MDTQFLNKKKDLENNNVSSKEDNNLISNNKDNLKEDSINIKNIKTAGKAQNLSIIRRFKTKVKESDFGYINYLCSILLCRTYQKKLYYYQMSLVKHAISFKIITNLLMGYILEETSILKEQKS